MQAKIATKLYNEWKEDGFVFEDLSSGNIGVETPYLDGFSDSISLLIREEEGKIVISDEGYTLWQLQTHGYNLLDDKELRFQLNTILDYSELEVNEEKEIIYQTNHSQLIEALNRYCISIKEIYKVISIIK